MADEIVALRSELEQVKRERDTLAATVEAQKTAALLGTGVDRADD